LNRFKSVLQLQGFPLKKAELVLKERKEKAKMEGFDVVSEMKWDIFNFHRSHNEFYNQFLADRKIEKWEDIPIMTKQDLQIPLEQRLSEGYAKKSVFVNKTSGSSGHPFIFAKDKFAHALTWAHIIDLYQQFNIKIGKSLEARFYGIPKDFKGHQKERLKDKMAKRYRFDIFDLSEKNLSTFVRVFQQKPFEYINGYTSSIVMFAKYLKDRNTVLKNICPSLKVCITTSEMLFENDRQLLRESFGVPVINEYGASELGVIAFENENLNWLLNNLTLYTEVVDENGKTMDFGQEGDLVITSLDNKAHPFIRYKIGDVGVLNQPIRNDGQTLEKLTGRTNVFAVLPSGKKVPALSFYYVTKSVIDNNGNVKELKVVQEKINQFLIRYVAEQELNSFQKTSIKNAIEKYLEPGLELRFIWAQALKRTKRGKLMQFESQL
jgi:phenylacetate-CoA ligase